jgi:hypothetical protein
MNPSLCPTAPATTAKTPASSGLATEVPAMDNRSVALIKPSASPFGFISMRVSFASPEISASPRHGEGF